MLSWEGASWDNPSRRLSRKTSVKHGLHYMLRGLWSWDSVQVSFSIYVAVSSLDGTSCLPGRVTVCLTCCVVVLFFRLQAWELGLQDFSGFVIDVFPVIRLVFDFWCLKHLKLSSKWVSAFGNYTRCLSVRFQINNSIFCVPGVH